MGYDDSNYDFSKNLGICCTLCTKLILRGGFFTKFTKLAQSVPRRASPRGSAVVVDETMTNENIFHIHNIDHRPAA